VIGLSSQQEILVTVYAGRDLDKPLASTPANAIFPGRSEKVVWTVNLHTKKIVCDLKGQQDTFRPDGTGVTHVRHFLSGTFNSSHVLYSGPFLQSLYDVEHCKKLHEMPENNAMSPTRAGDVGIEARSHTENLILSDDRRHIFGYDYDGFNPKNSPFRLWSFQDGKLIHDAHWYYDGAIAKAAFSPDSRYLAWATTNMITIYRIK